MARTVNYLLSMKIDPADQVDAGDVADIIGLSTRNAVSVYRKRYDDFPEPVFERNQCVLWLRQDIERWAAGHRRQRGPEPGTPRRR